MKPKLFQWQMENGEAFIFGRTDWQYVLNTFCFGYNVGYRFIQTKAGVCNGNFLGIGADDCYTAVVVEQSRAVSALLITNGEFVSFHGPDPTMVEVQGHQHRQRAVCELRLLGPVPPDRQDRRQGHGGLQRLHVRPVGPQERRPRTRSRRPAAPLLVRGCEFREAKPQIDLGEGVRRAVITDNVFAGDPAASTNRSPGNVQIANNVED